MKYRVKLRLSIGLTHGSGTPHYSLRQLLEVLKKSTLSTASLTVAQALGLEKGKEEDAVIVDILWPEAEVQELLKHCARLNNFVDWVFNEMGQRWILVDFITSRSGKPVGADHFSVAASENRNLELDRLIPSPPKLLLATVLIPMSAAGGDRAVRQIMMDLARIFGGCTVRQPVPDRAAYYWEKDIVVFERFQVIEIHLPRGARGRRLLVEYVQRRMLGRLKQDAISIQFASGKTQAETVVVHQTQVTPKRTLPRERDTVSLGWTPFSRPKPASAKVEPARLKALPSPF